VDADWLAETRASYDTVAAYSARLRGALDTAPYLRAALASFAESVRARGAGPVADVGCGPGHVTAHLRAGGLDAFGLDLSPGMIAAARREHPGLRFAVGSMTDLPLAHASLAGLVAFWSLAHVPDHALTGVFGHFRRALRPGGMLLLGYHAGEGVRLETEGCGGLPMKVRVHRRQPAAMSAVLRGHGFTVEAHLLLDPDAGLPGALLFARNQAPDTAPG
jgi:SAM-dependent methyltransferase